MAITTDERTAIIELTVMMFNAAPGATYLAQIVALYEANPGTQAQKLEALANQLSQTAVYTSLHPNFETAEEFAADFLTPLGLQNDAVALEYIIGRFNAGVSKGQIVYEAYAQLNAVPADGAAQYVVANAILENKTTVAEYYSITKDGAATDLLTLQSVLGGVTADTATIAQAEARIDNITISGQTFALTTGVDTINGTTGNDTINANPGASNAATFTALDSVDGGAGTDTMNISDVGTTGAVPYALISSATVKNVEVLNLITASDNVGDDVTADVSAWTGLQSVNVTISGVDAPVTALTTKGNATFASVSGATTAAITDSATTDTLASVTIADSTGLATITSDALTTLSLNASTGGATVTAAAATRALTLNLNGVTAGTVTDAEATSLTINASGTKSSGATVTTAKAKTVAIAADESLSLTALNVGAATAVTVTGDSLVTLAGGTFTALTSIDASAQTAGGVDAKALPLGTGVSFIGGGGADSIQLGATTKAIATGAGNDRVLLSVGVTTLGTGGTVDAGDGTADVLAFADADDAGTTSATATFEAKVSGFEVVELAGAAAAAVALNLANLDDIASVKLSADVVSALTISNMSTGGVLSVTASQTGATTVGVTNAVTGTADSVNVSVAEAAGVNTGALTIADVETVNYQTDDTATTPTGIQHTSNLTAAAVKAITVTGDAGLALTNTNTTVTSFDASGVSKGAVGWTTGALAAAATITGGAGANTVDFSAATKAVTYTGGAAVDTVTANNSANTINTAAGNDVVMLGTGANTVDLGAGNDTITLGAGLNVVTLGAGTDTVNMVIPTSGNTYSTIQDAAAGDILTFVDLGVETFASTKIALADTAVFQDFLDAAATGVIAGNAAIKWFQFAGNTYAVEDMSAATTFQNGADLVVKLTGLVDLSTATGAGTHALTLV